MVEEVVEETVIMGRELRRVPPNWEHPKSTQLKNLQGDKVIAYTPLREDGYEARVKEQEEARQNWSGTEEEFIADYGDKPNLAEYVDYGDVEPTWYQLYETVSEGTPGTPPFETLDEVAQYLAEHGDFWYQECLAKGDPGRRTKPTLEQARAMLKRGWAPSLVIHNGEMYGPYDTPSDGSM